MPARRGKPIGSTPGAKLVNKGGASKTPNAAAKAARGGKNSKGSPKKR